MIPRRLTHTANARTWDLAGLSVIEIVIGLAELRFLLASISAGSEDEIEVMIANRFTIRDTDGTLFVLDPEVAETLAPVPMLRLRHAHSMVAGRDGSLKVYFSDGVELEVQKHDRYESWQTSGSGAFSDATMLCSSHDGPPWGE